jgi:hypothetical protein
VVARLAFHTFNVLRAPQVHPRVEGFVDRFRPVYDSADHTPGCVAVLHTGADAEHLRSRAPGRKPNGPQTLSIWTDLASVFAFAYSGAHAEALRHRREWFVKADWPIYVAWWVPDDYLPTWAAAHERLEHRHDHGPTPYAFNFRSPFDAAGQPVTIDRPRVEEIRPSVR